jgi:hypothetical protein
MDTNTSRATEYRHLGETWYRHQVARIMHRHLQFGRYRRLDLDALLAGAASTISGAATSARGHRFLEQNLGVVIASRDAIDTGEFNSKTRSVFPVGSPYSLYQMELTASGS